MNAKTSFFITSLLSDKTIEQNIIQFLSCLTCKQGTQAQDKYCRQEINKLETITRAELGVMRKQRFLKICLLQTLVCKKRKYELFMLYL
jgi:hypothetical protein